MLTRQQTVIRKSFVKCNRNPILIASFHSTSFTQFQSTDDLDRLIDQYSRKKMTSVSIKALFETGKGVRLNHTTSSSDNMNAATKVHIQVARFLHRELPVRLAHRTVELNRIPLMQQSKYINEVCNWYKQSFQELLECETPTDIEKESKFAVVVEGIYRRHGNTLLTMAKGAHELRKLLQHDTHGFAEMKEIQNALDSFYMSRIGIRILISHYLALKAPQTNSDMVGIVCMNASPYDIARNAISDASYMCSRVHHDAPEVTIHGRTDLTFPYIPDHIHYMLVELLKNSMRATVEYHGIDNMPPIKIIIADGEDNEDVVIKVSDEGGGIKRSNMNKIWSYLFTTADPKVLEDTLNAATDFGTSTPLAGLGYGLPISRCYARQDGGDLVIMSMEGYGTDSFLYLSRIQ